MKVDKKQFKELKKEDGGLFGGECSVVAKILEAEDLKKVDSCNLSIHAKGLYMDFLLSYKLYFPLENLQEVNINDGIIEIYIESELPIRMKIEKMNDRVKVYNTLKKHLGEDDEKITLSDLIYTKTNVDVSEEPSYKVDYDNNVAHCPKCRSTSITANKKGFSLAKGAVGVVAVGALGAVAAGYGKNKVIATCLKCGHQWKPGR